ncbi:MAG: DNA-3-methyladenine glycosylase 2 family protein [Alphaproteobacteria bacterium]
MTPPKPKAASKPKQKQKQKQAQSTHKVPPVIASDADFACHIAALIDVEPHFAALYKITGKVDLRWLDPGFSGLVRVIAGQQISAAAGLAIFKRCEAALSKLAPSAVLAAETDTLRATGLSWPKIRTLRTLAETVEAGALDLDGLLRIEAEAAIAELCAVKGIGRWTAEVYLLFAAGHPDIFPAGDLALQNAVRQGFALAERPTEKALAAMAQDWQPFRSAAARLLWAYYAAMKHGGQNAAPA